MGSESSPVAREAIFPPLRLSVVKRESGTGKDGTDDDPPASRSHEHSS